MKFQDTVMKEEEIKDWVAPRSQPHGHIRVLKDVAERQAEISFKAGIREAVKFLKENYRDEGGVELFLSWKGCLIDEKDLDIKLREWGIEKW